MQNELIFKQIAQNWAIAKLRDAGIEVIEDYDEFERIFDDLIFSGEISMDKKNRIDARAAKVIDTSSVRLFNPHYYNTLNEIKSQVISIKISNLAKKISDNNELLSAEDYLAELKTLIGADETCNSAYLRNLINTNNYTLRLSGHNINSANARGDEKTTGITIKIDKSRFNDSEKAEVIEFVYFKDKLTKERMLGILFGIENWIKTGEYNYLDCDKINTSLKFQKKNPVPSVETLIINEGDVYGFTHEGKIYLNPYVLSSQTPIHEYTHLWDNYIQNTNKELWNKGLEAFKDTTIWNEVINDPNYADIKDDENLVLSKCHARITGKVAEKVLERIAKENGEIKKDEIIDWDKETWQYIAEIYGQDIEKLETVSNFLSLPIKDLMNEKNISVDIDKNYIYSEEFISKFGDWEKANRLEKLRDAKIIEKDFSIMLNDEDITEKVETLIKNKDRKGIQQIEKALGKAVVGKYINKDTNILIELSNNNIVEISHHQFYQKEHIQSIQYIPEIIADAIYIAEIKNEDTKKHPNIEKYEYYLTGLKIGGEDFTCKSVISIDKEKKAYYDHKLSFIEKSRITDFALKQKGQSDNLSSLHKQREIELPSYIEDKRLLQICQVPQLPYMIFDLSENKWLPTSETINLVENGNLYIKKHENNFDYEMINTIQKMVIKNQEELLYSPNGKKSNLSLDDYNFVRSPEFNVIAGEWEYKAAAEFALKTENVAKITGQEFQKEEGKSIIDKVLQYYNSVYDGKIENNNIGTVILDKEGIKDSLAHGMTKTKAAAYAVVPAIIQNGYLYNREKNWKGRNYDTAVLIAPVSIGGVDYVGEVILKQRPNKTGFYLHEVELKTKLAGMFKTPTKGSISTSSYLIITRHLDKVNNCKISFDENFEPSKEDIEKIKNILRQFPIQKMVVTENKQSQERPMENKNKNEKKYDFYVQQMGYIANGNDFMPFTGLSAKEAVDKFDRLSKEYNDIGIGINIYGDSIFDLKNGKKHFVAQNIGYQYEILPSYSNERALFDKLTTYDEHAQNFITALKELDRAFKGSENIKRYGNPNFIYEKENETKINQKQTTQQAQRWAINKLQNAGIEVITDKNEFNKILESEKLLQKMSFDLSELEKLSKQLVNLDNNSLELNNKHKELRTKINELSYNIIKKYANLIKPIGIYVHGDSSGFGAEADILTLKEKGFLIGEKKYPTDNVPIPVFLLSDRHGNIAIKQLGRTEGINSISSNTICDMKYSDAKNLDNLEFYEIELFPPNELIKRFTNYIKEQIPLEEKKQQNEINKLAFLEQSINESKEEELKLVSRETEEENVALSKTDKEILEKALSETAISMKEVIYSVDNYNKIFGKGSVESPIETVKLGRNQFIKLCPPNRNYSMGAIYETLTKPSIIFESSKIDNDDEFKTVHVYGKSFSNKESNILGIKSILIFRDEENIVITAHPRPISEIVKEIKTTNDIIYLDNEVSRKLTSLSQETGVSLTWFNQKTKRINPKYNEDKILSINKMIESGEIQAGQLEITKDNFDKYYNLFNQHSRYKDNKDVIASTLFHCYINESNKEEMKQWLENQGYSIDSKKVSKMQLQDGTTFGFTHEGKIYLNPDVINSQTPIHEYTHLWDNYIQNTNSELWNKGLEAFKDTTIWNEVINDPNYADIKDDENLVLSECHARICGKVAEKVLERIAKENGEIKKDEIIDWDKETWQYIAETYSQDISKFKSIKEFIEMPMKNLMEGKEIIMEQKLEQDKLEVFKDTYENFIKDLENPELDNRIKTDLEKIGQTPINVIYDANSPNMPEYIIAYDNKKNNYSIYERDGNDFTTSDSAINIFDTLEDVEDFAAKLVISDYGEKGIRYNDYILKDVNSINSKYIASNWTLQKLKDAGIEVIFNKKEFYSILENNVILQKSAKDSKGNDLNLQEDLDELEEIEKDLFTGTQNNILTPHQTSPYKKYTLNSNKKQDILYNLEKLNTIVQNNNLLSENNAEQCLAEIQKAFGFSGNDNTNYVLDKSDEYEKKQLRLSNHNTNAKTAKPDVITTSIIIKLYNSKFKKTKRAEVIEFVYDKETFTKEKMLGIIDGLKDWINNGEYTDTHFDKAYKTTREEIDNSTIQKMALADGTTYGFTHEGKIYLNPDVVNSATPIHEYTHLWDNYIQNTNSELWNKGLEAFKDTIIWNEVINDPHYADIKDDENLVLSECHARICGKVAEKVLERIAKENGEIKKDEIIDWDKETWVYIADNFGQDIGKFISIKEFIDEPLNQLFKNPYHIKFLFKEMENVINGEFKREPNEALDTDIENYGLEINLNDEIYRTLNGQKYSISINDFIQERKKLWREDESDFVKEWMINECLNVIDYHLRSIDSEREYLQLYSDIVNYIDCKDKQNFLEEYQEKKEFKKLHKTRKQLLLKKLAKYDEPSLFPNEESLLDVKEKFTNYISDSKNEILTKYAIIIANYELLKEYQNDNSFKYETEADLKADLLKKIEEEKKNPELIEKVQNGNWTEEKFKRKYPTKIYSPLCSLDMQLNIMFRYWKDEPIRFKNVPKEVAETELIKEAVNKSIKLEKLQNSSLYSDKQIINDFLLNIKKDVSIDCRISYFIDTVSEQYNMLLETNKPVIDKFLANFAKTDSKEKYFERLKTKVLNTQEIKELDSYSHLAKNLDSEKTRKVYGELIDFDIRYRFKNGDYTMLNTKEEKEAYDKQYVSGLYNLVKSLPKEGFNVDLYKKFEEINEHTLNRLISLLGYYGQEQKEHDLEMIKEIAKEPWGKDYMSVEFAEYVAHFENSVENIQTQKSNNLNHKAWENLTKDYASLINSDKIITNAQKMGKSEKYITSKIKKCHETFENCVDKNTGEINYENIDNLMNRIQEFGNSRYLEECQDKITAQQLLNGLKKYAENAKNNKYNKEYILEETKNYSKYFDYPIVATAKGFILDEDNIILIIEDDSKTNSYKHYIELQGNDLKLERTLICSEGLYDINSVTPISPENQLSIKDYLIENYPLIAKDVMDNIQTFIIEQEEINHNSLTKIEKNLNSLEKTSLSIDDFKSLQVWQHNEFDEIYNELNQQLKDYREERKNSFKENKIPFVEAWSENSNIDYLDNKYTGGITTLEDFQNVIENLDLDFYQKTQENDKAVKEGKEYPDVPYPDFYGYDKTDITIYNIPNTQKIPFIEDEKYCISDSDYEKTIEEYAKENNLRLVVPEYFSYKCDRYDIGDGNGNLFAFIRANPEAIKLNKTFDDLENTLYHKKCPQIIQNTIHKIFEKHINLIAEPLTEARKSSQDIFNKLEALKKDYIIDKTTYNKYNNFYKKSLQNIKNVYENEIQDITKLFCNSPLVKDENNVRFFKKEMRNFICDIKSPWEGSKIEYPDVEVGNTLDFWRDEIELLPANCELSQYINEQYDLVLKEKETQVYNNYKKEVEKNLYETNTTNVISKDIFIINEFLTTVHSKIDENTSLNEFKKQTDLIIQVLPEENKTVVADYLKNFCKPTSEEDFLTQLKTKVLKTPKISNEITNKKEVIKHKSDDTRGY